MVEELLDPVLLSRAVHVGNLVLRQTGEIQLHLGEERGEEKCGGERRRRGEEKCGGERRGEGRGEVWRREERRGERRSVEGKGEEREVKEEERLERLK